MTENVYDTIIVGGGIAGLTSAAFLSKNGRKVLLIEKNRECGGLVSSINHNGFHFEAGVRALEDAGIILPMLKELGIKLEMQNSPVSVGVGKDIVNIGDIHSLEDYKQLLIKLYPDSEEDIQNLIRIIGKIMRSMEVLYGVENPVIKDVWKDKKFLFFKLLPWLPRFLLTIGKINRMQMPVESYLETIVKDPSLRDIISQHFFRNTPAFFALSYFSLYLDYFYPRGGVGKLAEAVESRLIDLGGEIKTETTVLKVEAAEQILADQDGHRYSYRKLIWAADLKTFYRITDTGGLPDKIRGKFENEKNRMLAQRGGDSVYTLYLEVDEPLDSFRRISHGHFFYTPLTKGLGETHRGELDHLLYSRDQIKKDQWIQWLDRFTSLNTYEISIPGLKEAALAPPGQTGLIVSFLTEYDLFQRVKQDGWYKDFVSELEDRVVKVLSDSVYPMLKDKVIHRFSFTPLSIQNRVGSSEGAITGWSFQNPVPVIHEMQKSGRSVLTPIPSIYQAGQWTYSPAGVPMSILTGKLAADRVLK
jgi:phytoene dehydrogenase-like protein